MRNPIKSPKPQIIFTLCTFFKTIMTRILLFLSLTLSVLSNGLAQMHDPVDWSFAHQKLSENEVELQMTAQVEEGWHLYAVYLPDSTSVIPTSFQFDESSSYRLLGKLQEPEPIVAYDPNFMEELSWHSGKSTFTQKIEILSTENLTVKGELGFMVCNEEMCLPPEYLPMKWELKGIPAAQEKAGNSENEEAEGEEAAAAKNTPNQDEINDTATTGTEATLNQNETARQNDPQKGSTSANEEAETKSESYSTDPTEKSGATRSLISIFILSFLGGFAALLTPCVFPMIPLTVSFFTKQSKTRAKGIANAIVYGIAIVVLYTLLGFFITWAFGADALNAISTDPYVNIAFFVLLVVFAISFFGAFEITLPSSWVNKSDAAADKGGILGIFFMALTLAIVSFSCTGPIIGTLLFEASTGGVQGPLVGMFGFSLALALPFGLFAAFPGWLNSLPKSGGWLNSVKVVLGFIELAFAFKFLSNADLVWDSGLLLREHFLAIWIAIGLLLTVYLLGGFRMPHDSKLEKVSVFRLLLSIFSLYFVVYLLPGLWGAPLKMISGFPPPMFYSENSGSNSFTGGGAGSNLPKGNGSTAIPEGADPDHCPLHLNCFHDFEQGLAYAQKVDKPILLDFTGRACVNCRKMEQNVWSDPQVLNVLQNEVVLISLYVDLQTKLPEKEQYTSEVTGKKIRTIGNKWSEFQVKFYQTNSQPQYVIIGHDSMEPLIPTTAYDPDVSKYLDWLKKGIRKFDTSKN